MANQEEGDAVTIYERCDICRRNYKQGKGHVYSKAHRTVLQNVITKFTKKVSVARRCVKTPHVYGAGWEEGARRWCYFCKSEVVRHRRDALTVTQDAGFLQHLASELHKKNTLKFWWQQRLEKDKHVYFLIDEEKLKKFEIACKEAVETYLGEQEKARKTEAARIARQEVMRMRLVTHNRRHVMSQIAQEVSGRHQGAAPRDQTRDLTRDHETTVRTVSAKAAGLTVVTPRAYDSSVGNIYSGTMPPWLQTDTSGTDTAPVEIGPTEHDLRKHFENEQKRKLPATRVGAQMVRTEKPGDAWLPGFGRVWSTQRRTHGQKHFMHSLNKSGPSGVPQRRRVSSAEGRAWAGRQRGEMAVTTSDTSTRAAVNLHSHRSQVTGNEPYVSFAPPHPHRSSYAIGSATQNTGFDVNNTHITQQTYRQGGHGSTTPHGTHGDGVSRWNDPSGHSHHNATDTQRGYQPVSQSHFDSPVQWSHDVQVDSAQSSHRRNSNMPHRSGPRLEESARPARTSAAVKRLTRIKIASSLLGSDTGQK